MEFEDQNVPTAPSQWTRRIDYYAAQLVHFLGEDRTCTSAQARGIRAVDRTARMRGDVCYG